MSFLEHYTRVYYENLQKFTNIRETQQKPRKKFSNFSMASILDEKEPETIESISTAPVNPVHLTPDFWSLYSQALQYPVQKPVDIKKSENKPKRVRTIFTQIQIDRLEIEFKKSQYMIGTDRIELAKELNLSETQVKVWFQNRRIKSRKQKKIVDSAGEDRSGSSSENESETSLPTQ